MVVRISLAFYAIAPLLYASSGQLGAVPQDETWLIQFQTTMDRRSSDNDAVMSENLAAELMPILSTLPNMSRIAAADPVQAICKQVDNWLSPLTRWLNITLNESHKNIDTVLNDSLVMQENVLKVLRNKTSTWNKDLSKAEVVFSAAMLPGGVVEKQVMKALAPMNLGSLLHLDRYKVAKPDVGKNATFYDLLMKGLLEKLRVGLNETDRRAKENATKSFEQLEASLQAGVEQMELFGKKIGVSLGNLTGTLSKDMEAVVPGACSSVYEQPIGNANKTIDDIENNLQIKLSKLSSGIHEASSLLKAVVHTKPLMK